MANQKAILNLSGGKSLRLTLVDTDATASTFTDYGAATSWVADSDYLVLGIQGQGTTAPATATAFQFRVNGNDVSKFINGAAVFDPKSSQAERLGTALGARIPRGSTVALIGRA